MARQLLVPKVDIEFLHLTDYTAVVHPLGASLLGRWCVVHHHFCQYRRHFSTCKALLSDFLPADSGQSIVGGTGEESYNSPQQKSQEEDREKRGNGEKEG